MSNYDPNDPLTKQHLAIAYLKGYDECKTYYLNLIAKIRAEQFRMLMLSPLPTGRRLAGVTKVVPFTGFETTEMEKR